MTTVKNVTEEIKKLKGLTGFLVPIKLMTKTEGEKKRKKSKRIYRTSQKVRIINVFLELLLSESFPMLESQFT